MFSPYWRLVPVDVSDDFGVGHTPLSIFMVSQQTVCASPDHVVEDVQWLLLATAGHFWHVAGSV